MTVRLQEYDLIRKIRPARDELVMFLGVVHIPVRMCIYTCTNIQLSAT